MKKIILIISIFIFSVGCEKDEIEQTEYPSCFQNSINSILDNNPMNPRSNIKKYEYQNEIVFVVYRNGIADEQFDVTDKNCELICKFGGISGDDTCIDWDNAMFLETIWTDNR